MNRIKIPGLKYGDKSKAAKLLGVSHTLVNRVVSGEHEDTCGVIIMLEAIAASNTDLKEKASILRVERLKYKDYA